MNELPAFLIDPIIRAALAEDLGRAGDITTDRIVPLGLTASANLTARRAGCIAGLGAAEAAFRVLDPHVRFSRNVPDGAAVEAGAVIASIEGCARALLSGERVALNLLCHLSGIATETDRLVKLVAGHKARVTCTRKTNPGLRALEKYAVTCGGGLNHRFGLDDGILIKDNHIAIAGSVRKAITRARRSLGHLVKVEIEVDTLDQLRETLEIGGVDVIMLDNMQPPTLAEAVKIIDGRAISEASGGVTAATIADIAATGVDLISVGWITHSAPVLDIGLDF